MTRSRLHQCPQTGPCLTCQANRLIAVLESGRPNIAAQLAHWLAEAIPEALGQAIIRGRQQAMPQPKATIRPRPAPETKQ